MGLAKVEHKPSISKEDLRKVYNCGSFYTEDPKGYKTKYGLKLCCFSVDEGEKTYRNKTLDRALDPRANGTWLSKLTE